jgi:hypothetical protein
MSIISGNAIAESAIPIDPRDYFNTILYTGNGDTGQTITGVGFQPDLVFLNNRSTGGGYPKEWFDAVRGAGLMIRSNGTNAEVTANAFGSFTSDGFSLPSGFGNSFENDGSAGGQPYVAWCWKANGAGVSNTDGNITSTVSASPNSGFSIVTYTGNGSANQTVGHGLGVAPVFGILKDRDPNSNNSQWQVFNTTVGDDYAYLSTTAAFSGIAEFYPTSGSSTTVTVGRDVTATTNESGDRFVMYLFAPVDGFSAFGTYTGNGSATGPSVTTDFEPTFLLVKRTDSTGDWVCYDYARSPSNPRNKYLEWNNTDVEGTGFDVDFNSTSFQIKSSDANVNANGGTYIYMCIA